MAKMALKSDSKVLVDSLPYMDKGYDEAARQEAMSLIEEECKRYRPTKDYLAYLPQPKTDVFETELMKAEMDRIAQRQPMDPLDMRRYELPDPPGGKRTDINAWQAALDNSKAQLEHQSVRLENLDLMQEYGPEGWKAYNGTLVRLLSEAQKELAKLRHEIQEINFERKRKQADAGSKLEALESSWVSLISKNYQIELACAEVEQEITPLRKKFKKLEDTSEEELP